jgi:hypothetical protein
METIRFASLEDSHKAVKLLLNFKKESGLPFKTSAAWALNLFQCCVRDEDKIALIKDGGILLGAVSDSLLGPFKQAHEIVWWVDPEKRGNSLSMIKEYEDWAINKGASFIELKSLNKFKETEKIYERLGYSPIETSWIKVI